MNSSSRRHFYYSGNLHRQIGQLEKLIEIQAFCGHDLRSQIGAAVGMLRILGDDPQSSFLRQNRGFIAALKSAEEALASLDTRIRELNIGYQIGWLLSDEEPSGEPEQGVPEDVSRLFVRYPAKENLLLALPLYRPAALFLSARLAGSDLLPIVQRAGPRMTKIFVFEAPDIHGLPPGVSISERARLSWSGIHRAWNDGSF